MFILSNATGELSKAKPLDREIKDFYSLLVSASDQGQSPLSSNTTINITIIDANDQTPEIHTQTIFIIPEVQLYHFFIYHFINFSFVYFFNLHSVGLRDISHSNWQSEKVLKNPSYFHSIHTVFCLPFQWTTFLSIHSYIHSFVRSFTHSFINHSSWSLDQFN